MRSSLEGHRACIAFKLRVAPLDFVSLTEI